MKALVATAMLTLALLGSTGSAFACKDGKCCDCCGDKATKTETPQAPAPHH